MSVSISDSTVRCLITLMDQRVTQVDITGCPSSHRVNVHLKPFVFTYNIARDEIDYIKRARNGEMDDVIDKIVNLEWRYDSYTFITPKTLYDLALSSYMSSPTQNHLKIIRYLVKHKINDWNQEKAIDTVTKCGHPEVADRYTSIFK